MQKRRPGSAIVFGPLAGLAVAAAPAAGQATFQPLGHLPGSPSPFSVGLGISDDGRAVVGWASSPRGTSSAGCCEAFIWTSAEGLQPLSDLAGPAFESQAQAVSGDGSVIVGYGHTSVTVGALWNGAAPPVQIPELSGGPIGGAEALGISRDGEVVVGYDWAANGLEGFIYRRSSGGILGMGDLAGGPFESRAWDVSADGEVVVGSGRTADGTEATSWARGSLRGLGDLPGGAVHSEARAVSGDGSVIVGFATGPEGRQAVRWTARGIEPLGDLPGGDFFSIAADVSEDGSVVVGYSKTARGEEAFIWTEAWREMRNLREVLAEAGADLTGWRLSRASGVSANGAVFTGHGFGFGPEEAWIASLPFCAPDLNGDGEVDFFDFLLFQDYFAAGDLRADFTGDGVLDFFDFLAFQQAVAEGCH